MQHPEHSLMICKKFNSTSRSFSLITFLLSLLSPLSYGELNFPLPRPIDRQVGDDISEMSQPTTLKKLSNDIGLPPAKYFLQKDEMKERFRINRIIFNGNNNISDDELSDEIAPFIKKEITLYQIEAIRNRIVMLYVKRGYIGSGALIHEQSIVDGTLTIDIIEGELTDIEITGITELPVEYIENYLSPLKNEVIKIDDIRERLYILQQSKMLDRINAKIKPGDRLGEIVLDVQVKESISKHLDFQLSNYQVPAVGETLGSIAFEDTNVSGNVDRLFAFFSRSEGSYEAFFDYSSSVYYSHHRLGLYLRSSHSNVISDPFKSFQIENKSDSMSLYYENSFFRKPFRKVDFNLNFEHKYARSYLRDELFSFNDGSVEGKARVSVIRGALQWLERFDKDIIVGRVTYNKGLHFLNATEYDGTADGEFESVLLQGQWLKFWRSNSFQTLIKGSMQQSNGELLSLEKYSIGGHSSVRGYNENQFVRDEGWQITAEYRQLVNLYRYDMTTQYSIFYDAGEVSNASTIKATESIASFGVGFLFKYQPGGIDNGWQSFINIEIANPIKPIKGEFDGTLQRQHLHIALGINRQF